MEPHCPNCLRRPNQMRDIVLAGAEEGLTSDEFVWKYRVELGVNRHAEFICADCKRKQETNDE